MKSLRIISAISACLFFYGTLASQVINIPNKSEKHFAEKYPNAKKVDWKNNVTDYSASFELDNSKHKAHYHMDGVWDYTESFIPEESFPNEVKTSFKKSRYADWNMGSTALVENNKGEKMYRYEIKKGIEKKYIFFSKDGKEVKTKGSI